MEETGNVAAMRKALEMAKNAICHQFRYNCQSLGSTTSNIQANCGNVICAMRRICEAKTAINNALAAPPRNCDKFADDESAWKAYVAEHGGESEFGEPGGPDPAEYPTWLFDTEAQEGDE